MVLAVAAAPQRHTPQDALIVALKELAQEWRQRRPGADTDAGYAVRVGCAERLEEIIERQRV